MKPRNKKILITAGTILLLSPISYVAFNRDYHFAKSFGLTEHAQKIFWNLIGDNDRFKKAGGLVFSKTDTGAMESPPVFKGFFIDLDDQWSARYGYNPWPGNEDVFEVDIINTANPDKNFIFYVSQKDLKIIKDDVKHRMKGTISPEERQQIDRETTPDSITDTDYLEKLALDKFVEFQDEYFKVN